jgi:hypothetical protein
VTPQSQFFYLRRLNPERFYSISILTISKSVILT